MTAIVERVTLDDLAETANAEHGSAMSAASQAVAHVVLAGRALLDARRRVESGRWLTWLHENFKAGDYTAYVYMRIAKFEDALSEHHPTSIEHAIRLLKELGLSSISESGKRIPIETKQEALGLRQNGLSLREVADVLGISGSSVLRFENPKAFEESQRRKTERRTQRRKEKAALRQKQRDEAMRKRGGKPAEAYSLIRKAAQELDRALAAEENTEVCSALRHVLGKLHGVEDGLAAALKIP